jgi:methionyl-tRNA synthetase
METVLYVTAEVVRQIAILAQPAVPAAAAKLLDSLGQGRDKRAFADLGRERRLVAGTPVPAPTGVFPRHVEPSAEGRTPQAPEG